MIWKYNLLLSTVSLISLMFISCISDEKRYRENARITSPDSLVDAVIMYNYGPLTINELVTNIYIVPEGEKVDDYDHYNFLAVNVESLSVKWSTAKILEIHYRRAVIMNFRNVWSLKSINNYHYHGEITLYKHGN